MPNLKWYVLLICSTFAAIIWDRIIYGLVKISMSKIHWNRPDLLKLHHGYNVYMYTKICAHCWFLCRNNLNLFGFIKFTNAFFSNMLHHKTKVNICKVMLHRSSFDLSHNVHKKEIRIQQCMLYISLLSIL